jgi:serine protease Do
MIVRGYVRTMSVVLLALLMVPAAARSAPPAATSESLSLPGVFDKAVPENVQDLKAIQDHVKQLLPKTVPVTVGLRIGGASGSGVIVSKDGYILTAGHVSGKEGQDVQILLHDGKTLKGKTLGANRGIDSGMIKITQEGEYPFAEMAENAELKKGAWCLAIGHPGGFQKGRSPVVRLGRVLETNKGFLRTDCTLVGGDSGGPLFDMHGRVIGIHSRIGNAITANIHVPVETYRESWDKLAAGEVWGSTLFGPRVASDTYLGVRRDPDAKEYRIELVAPESPAEKAGLRVNDVILSIDGKKIVTTDDLTRFLGGKKAGNQIAVLVQRGDANLTLNATLIKRAN